MSQREAELERSRRVSEAMVRESEGSVVRLEGEVKKWEEKEREQREALKALERKWEVR